MSVIGTGVAAGVAQAAAQAQQVARHQGRQEQDDSASAQRLRDQFEHHLNTVEENQEETPAQLRVTDQPHDRPKHEHHKHNGPADTPGDTQDAADHPFFPQPDPPADPNAHLYHHVDLTA
jgi:hypothetical protein